MGDDCALTRNGSVQRTAAEGTFDFRHEEHDTGGTKFPTRAELSAHDPETGEERGRAKYFPPKRRNAPLHIEEVQGHVPGAASALLNEIEARHPGSPTKFLYEIKRNQNNGNSHPNAGQPSDWGSLHPHLADTVHRGITLRLSSHAARVVNSADASKEEHLAHLHAALPPGNSLGMHWTENERAAQRFAHNAVSDYRTDIPVVLHARTPAQKDLETRRDHLYRGGVFPYGDPHSQENEVPLRKGRKVAVTGISWRPDAAHPDADENGWVHHTYGEPVQHMAAVDSAFSVWHLATQEPDQMNDDEPVADVSDLPHTCSYCGSQEFGQPEDTGRGLRAICSACGGAMLRTEDGQWTPAGLNSTHNHPRPDPDPMTGGVGGAANVGSDPDRMNDASARHGAHSDYRSDPWVMAKPGDRVPCPTCHGKGSYEEWEQKPEEETHNWELGSPPEDEKDRVPGAEYHPEKDFFDRVTHPCEDCDTRGYHVRGTDESEINEARTTGDRHTLSGLIKKHEDEDPHPGGIRQPSCPPECTYLTADQKAKREEMIQRHREQHMGALNDEIPWCAHLYHGNCTYPGDKLPNGTVLGIPQDRGPCPWKNNAFQQAACPISEPGPMAVMQVSAALHEGSWADVREKAKRIRREGGVIIRVSSADGVAGEVQGDHHVYETAITWVPGTSRTAYWTCGCIYGAYGHGPRWDNRPCSHVLAMRFEAQSRSAYGRELQADEKAPDWLKPQTSIVTQYERPSEQHPSGRDLTRRAVPPGNMRSEWHGRSRTRRSKLEHTAADEAFQMDVQRAVDKARDNELERHQDDNKYAENNEPLNRSDLHTDRKPQFAFSHNSDKTPVNPWHEVMREIDPDNPSWQLGQNDSPVNLTHYRSPVSREPLHLDEHGNSWRRHYEWGHPTDQYPTFRGWSGPHSATETLDTHPTWSTGHDAEGNRLQHQRTHAERERLTGTLPGDTHHDIVLRRNRALTQAGWGVVSAKQLLDQDVDAAEVIQQLMTEGLSRQAARETVLAARGRVAEYDIDDVSKHYGWEGFDPYELQGLHPEPHNATFTHEDVPVHSLRLRDGHGGVRPAYTYDELASQGQDERDRLNEVERGHEQGVLPPIVVVRHGDHHIIADGSHRAAVAQHRGDNYISAYVADPQVDAMKNEGYEFHRREPDALNGRQHHEVTAYDPDGEWAGEVHGDAAGNVHHIEVEPGHEHVPLEQHMRRMLREGVRHTAKRCPECGATLDSTAGQCDACGAVLPDRSVTHRAKKGPLQRPHRCHYCKQPATKAVKHSEGLAFIPACNKHLDDAQDDAANCLPYGGGPDYGNIDGVVDLPQKTAAQDARTMGIAAHVVLGGLEGRIASWSDDEQRCPHCGGYLGPQAFKAGRCPHCGHPLAHKTASARGCCSGSCDCSAEVDCGCSDDCTCGCMADLKTAAIDYPGYAGSQGPFESEYSEPHVYARDIHSGAGNCVCGGGLGDPLHIQAAPGVDVPEHQRYAYIDQKHRPHRTQDARKDAPEFGQGVDNWGLTLVDCPQCGGKSGCGHCGGTGQVISMGDTTANPTPDQNPAAGKNLREDGISDTSALHPWFAAKKSEGPTVAGVALKAADTGRILMLQRGLEDQKDPARGLWEHPGGHIEDGDKTTLHAGIREWEEEVGQPFPEGGVVTHAWTSPNGVYQGHVVVIPRERDLVMHDGRVVPNPDDPHGDKAEQAAWWDIDHARKNPALRPEVKQTPWNKIKDAGRDAGLKVEALLIRDVRGVGVEPVLVSGREQGNTHEAAAWDPLYSLEEAQPVTPPPHSNSENPASTGFLTNQDPASWSEVTQKPHHLMPADSLDSPLATLHDVPEGALPFTDGDLEDSTSGVEDPFHSQTGDNDSLDGDTDTIPNTEMEGSPMENLGGVASRRSIAEIVEQFQRTAGAAALQSGSEGSSAMGFSDGEIAAVARERLAGLSKTALKNFSPEEQRELIGEGQGSRARNFGNLQLEGTHYAPLQEALDAAGVNDDDILIL